MIIIIKIKENSSSNNSNYQNISINDNYDLTYYENMISHKSNNYNYIVKKKNWILSVNSYTIFY